jgi:uncharacterized protein (TIGR03437 family)
MWVLCATFRLRLTAIAVKVPASLTDGDWPVQTSIGGVVSPAGTILTVHQ